MQTVSRRSFLAQASAALCLLGSQSLRAFAADAPEVRTPLGNLRGEFAEGVRIFRGIPFAQPPLGPLRFKPPVKAAGWSGTRSAQTFSPAPIQPKHPNFDTSEDCLYLNVWAPIEKGTYPVFVYIHGGGFTAGRSFDPGLDGASFAREGIVTVTVAYRLGIFGFLDVSPLLGDAYSGSANNALRDLIATLQWVQDNIAAFGGDPKQVTIGGESAGAKLTDILMGVPAAQNLFHSMISESGGAERVWSAENSAKVAHGYADLLHTSHPEAALKTASPEILVSTQSAFLDQWPQHFPLRCEVDAILLPRTPVETIAAGSTRGKRLLIGTNLDESALFIGPHPSHNATAADLGNMPLPRFEAVYEKYKNLYPELTVEQRRIRAVSAEEYWIPSTRVAEAHVKGGGNAWMYRLDFAETSGRLKGYAYHSLDNALVWNYPHKTIDNAAAEATLASQTHTAWIAFIKGKAPASPGLPEWPEYTLDSRKTMLLDNTSTVVDNPHEKERQLWDGVL